MELFKTVHLINSSDVFLIKGFTVKYAEQDIFTFFLLRFECKRGRFCKITFEKAFFSEVKITQTKTGYGY